MIINPYTFTSAPSYPASLKLFIDAGNPLSYSGSGTTVTDLIGTQNGTLTNGVSFDSANGGSFYFDGTNDYITFGNNASIKPTSSGTISIWCKVIDNGTEFNGTMFMNTNSSSYKGIIIRGGSNVYESGKMAYYLCGDSSRASGFVTSDNTFTGLWKMFTLSWDNSTRKAYLNGNLIYNLSNSVTVTNNSTHPTLLGCNTSYGDFIKGNISQLKIYDTQLSDADILADFSAIKSRYGY